MATGQVSVAGAAADFDLAPAGLAIDGQQQAAFIGSAGAVRVVVF